MDVNNRQNETPEKLKFDYVDLENESDGSVADVEDDVNDSVVKTKQKKKKMKKKKIHFRSDFVGEKESSSDEDDQVSKRKRFTIQEMNPSDLTWMMWIWYYMVFASTSTFHAAEFCGEKLAYFFGITTPKYQYVINEYHRLKQEEKEEEEALERAQEYLRQKENEKLSTMEGGAFAERQG